MIGVDRRLRNDHDSEQNEARSSEQDFDVDLTSDGFHLGRERELLQERYARLDGDETLLSDERRLTVEIGILTNGIDH